MIKINITNKKYLSGGTRIYKITVDGHAPSGGVDCTTGAVCAAVSMATLMTANSLKFLSLGDHYVTSEIMPGHFEIATKDDNRNVESLIENLSHTLAELQGQYSDYIDLIKYTTTVETEEENMTPEEALVKLGNIQLEDPAHPHLSYPVDEIVMIQRAYKILEDALVELRILQEEY